MAAINIKQLSETVPMLKFKHTPNPAWASDAGRNSNSGKWGGTFAGYFSSIEMDFGNCTQAQMATIKNAFEHATCQVTYPDSLDGNPATEYFYGTAINGEKDRWTGRYKPFSITLTALNPYDERTR